MHRLRLLPLLAATALTGTALATAAQAEVIIRIAPVHTDAMVENYNPNNPTGPQRVRATSPMSRCGSTMSGIRTRLRRRSAVSWELGADLK